MTDDHRVGGQLYVFVNEYDQVIIQSRTTHIVQEIYVYPNDLKHLYNRLGKILMRQEDEITDQGTDLQAERSGNASS